MQHREDIWGREEALKGRPFLYLNGSLFYGAPGEHHNEVIDRYDLTKYPSSDNNYAGRVWPDEGYYWTWQSEIPEVRQALENEFSKEHSGSYDKAWIETSDGMRHYGPTHLDILDELQHSYQPADVVRFGGGDASMVWNARLPGIQQEYAEKDGSHLGASLWPMKWIYDPRTKQLHGPAKHHYEIIRNMINQLGASGNDNDQHSYLHDDYLYLDQLPNGEPHIDEDWGSNRMWMPPVYEEGLAAARNSLQENYPGWQSRGSHLGAYADDRCWMKLKDGRVFKGMTHMDLVKLLYEHGLDYPDVAQFGGGDSANYWNNMLKYHGSHSDFPKDHQASIDPEPLSEDDTYPVDNLVLKHADPIAGQAGEWANQRVPFLYLPEAQYLYYGNPGDHHFGLVQQAYTDLPDKWNTGHISGFLRQDGTHKIFNSSVWPNAIKPHMELLKQQLSDPTQSSVHAGRVKEAALHKFVWADGKFAVTPNIQHDPGLMHHGDLVDELGFGDSFGPMAQNIVAGEYYYPGDMEIVYQRGEHPDKAQLAQLVQTTEPVPLYSNFPKKADTDDGYRWNDITSFCYDPFTERLYLSGVDQDYHYGLLERKPELMNHLDRLIWGQIHEYYKGDQSRGDVEWFSDHLNDQSAEEDYYNAKLTDSLKYKICQLLANQLGWEIRDTTGNYMPQNTKQAAGAFPFRKYVWADGKVNVGPLTEDSNDFPWHTQLINEMGYNYDLNNYHLPEEWSVGYYYPHDHSLYQTGSMGNIPDDYSIVKQIHNHLEDGNVHAPRSSAMEITRDNPWIRTKDGRYFEGVHGQSSHMQLMWDNNLDPEEVAEYGGGEMAYYWNSTVTSVYHPYECQPADYFFDTM